MIKPYSILAVSLMVSLLCTPVYAQSNRDVVNRLNRLENDINTLSRAVYRGEDPPPSVSSGRVQADTEIRLQQLESEMRNLTGKMEELAYENKQIRSNLERITNDLMLRMQDVEQGSSRSSGNQVFNPNTHSSASSGIEPQAGIAHRTKQDEQAASSQGYAWQSEAAKPKKIPLKPSADTPAHTLGTLNRSASGAVTSSTAVDQAASRYEHAFSLLKSEKYGEAEAIFDAFLKEYPDHVLSGNAKYWLGETYYVRARYDEAARVFAEGYQQYPKGAKAPDNLLKLGLSLAALGSADDACLALVQLEKEFPNGAGPVLRRANQEKLRLGCS